MTVKRQHRLSKPLCILTGGLFLALLSFPANATHEGWGVGIHVPFLGFHIGSHHPCHPCTCDPCCGSVGWLFPCWHCCPCEELEPAPEGEVRGPGNPSGSAERGPTVGEQRPRYDFPARPRGASPPRETASEQYGPGGSVDYAPGDASDVDAPIEEGIPEERPAIERKGEPAAEPELKLMDKEESPRESPQADEPKEGSIKEETESSSDVGGPEGESAAEPDAEMKDKEESPQEGPEAAEPKEITIPEEMESLPEGGAVN